MGALAQAMMMTRKSVAGGIPAVVGQALLYTGNGGSRSITGASFSPDLVIGKLRPGAIGNAPVWTDSVRGVTRELYSNTTSAESIQATGLTSFDANGFSVGSSSLWNTNGAAYLALVLQQVAGAFEILTYTGTASAHAISHGLGVVPELIIIKLRSASGTDWAVYPGPLSNPGTRRLFLSTTAAVATSSQHWNNTNATATDFTVGTNAATNQNGSTYVAYLFASVNPGVKVGTYTGDGNPNGPSVTIGFKAKFIIIKRTDSTGSWVVFDDQRDPTSPHNTYNHLNIGGAVAESVTTNAAGGMNFTATDFQSIDSAAADINISGATYLYLAVA